MTGRRKELTDQTIEWINQHFPDCFEEIYFMNHYSISEEQHKKSEVLQSLGIRYMVEDSLSYARECSLAGITVFLMTKPWNKKKDFPGVIRVDDWHELYDKLCSIIQPSQTPLS